MAMRQWDRKCTLIVANQSGDALDLSQFRIRFKVKKSDAQTPNTAVFQITNLNRETIQRIQSEFTRVTFQAGYKDNYGVIFDGDIKQVIDGLENEVDTFLTIVAGDGDAAYNFSIVNSTLAAGATQADQVAAALDPMQGRGVTSGFIDGLNEQKLPRGKVMFGMSRDYLRQSAESSDSQWSIQEGKVQFIPLTGVLPGQAVVLNSQSGLIGIPQQTIEGVKAKCLLNPMLKIGGKVTLNEKDILKLQLDLGQVAVSNNIPAGIASDGLYFVLVCEHSGDTRGNDWYTDLVCLSVDPTAPPMKGVKGY